DYYCGSYRSGATFVF
nr:immunoglobulin light chain junction region [Macaca mulatta]MOW14887.1 immunoglobulin light chain junction region [Macaca mulatta]MOW14891.1 immunoglobulin light chain junction region [Macaca mulatta]MOW14895.1 immunoglobulin light chain junction region [Macaca mulatta]MOW14915.1 immunoglobulin light chain junction region [Macaca mulatta]